MKKLNKKGFTIVELSIVIAVIAILSAVLIPTFSSIVKNSKDSAAVQEAQNAYTQYLSENAANPAEDFIYKYDDNRCVVIKDGQLVKDDTTSEVKLFTEAAAKTELNCKEDDEATEANEKNYTETDISENFKAYTVNN